MRKISSKLVVAMIGTLALNVLAAEMPRFGMVYNTKEASSLAYGCKKINDALIECEFSQTSIRKKANVEDLNAKLDEAKARFPKEKSELKESDKLSPIPEGAVEIPIEKPDMEMCKKENGLIDIVRGKKKAPTKEGQEHFESMSETEKKDLAKLLDAVENYCNNTNIESYLNLVRVTHERETRVCFASSHTFKQSFRLVQDDASGAYAWVVKDEPSGPCGIVQLSRFEPYKPKGSTITFWKYTAKKAVTNKQGSDWLVACKDMDENEYLYDWMSKERMVGCDYIEFSPI